MNPPYTEAEADFVADLGRHLSKREAAFMVALGNGPVPPHAQRKAARIMAKWQRRMVISEMQEGD